MNVSKFINSKSIASYLQHINYDFSALEVAYLVWQSEFATLDEKIEGWEEVINSMPDMPVEKRRWGWMTDEPSLHSFLRRYIDYTKRKIKRFYEVGEYVYSYEILYEGYRFWSNDGRVFSSLDLCQNAVKSEDYLSFYFIKKQRLNSEEYIEAIFNSEHKFYKIYSNVETEADEKIDSYFDGLWLKFPTPFKRGDIVYQGNRQVYWGTQKKEPFVLTEMCTWDEKELRENCYTDEVMIARRKALVQLHAKDGDYTDMHVNGYFIDSHGRMYREHTLENYLDLEFYEDELPKDKRVLTAISNFEKGKINIDLLANAYNIFNDSLRIEHTQNYACFTDDELKLMGLK